MINLCFRSGMSSKSDLRGTLDAGVPVGVVAGLLTTAQILMALPRYLDDRGWVFMDSGAFTAERTGLPMDWSKVLRDYETLAGLTDRPERLFIVSPDKIGDQMATLGLLREYKPRLVALINTGARLIVPLQCGDLPAAQMLALAIEILGTDNFVAGIPSNKAAMSTDECRTLIHPAFHILGRVQLNEEQQSRVAALREGNSATFISADANWLRSRLSIVRKKTLDNRYATRPTWGQIDHPRVRAIKEAIQFDLSWPSASNHGRASRKGPVLAIDTPPN